MSRVVLVLASGCALGSVAAGTLGRREATAVRRRLGCRHRSNPDRFRPPSRRSAFGVVPRWRGRRARARTIERALPVWLDGVVGRLRAGEGLTDALLAPPSGDGDPRVRAGLHHQNGRGGGRRGALAGELALVRADVASGRPLVDALAAWRARCPVAGVALTVAACTLVHETGAARTEALDLVAATTRDRLAVAGEARALATQARASAAVIVAAPVGFAAFLGLADGESLAFLFGTAVGRTCVVGGLVLNGLGAWWMHRITEAGA